MHDKAPDTSTNARRAAHTLQGCCFPARQVCRGTVEGALGSDRDSVRATASPHASVFSRTELAPGCDARLADLPIPVRGSAETFGIL